MLLALYPAWGPQGVPVTTYVDIVSIVTNPAESANNMQAQVSTYQGVIYLIDENGDYLVDDNGDRLIEVNAATVLPMLATVLNGIQSHVDTESGIINAVATVTDINALVSTPIAVTADISSVIASLSDSNVKAQAAAITSITGIASTSATVTSSSSVPIDTTSTVVSDLSAITDTVAVITTSHASTTGTVTIVATYGSNPTDSVATVTNIPANLLYDLIAVASSSQHSFVDTLAEVLVGLAICVKTGIGKADSVEITGNRASIMIVSRTAAEIEISGATCNAVLFDQGHSAQIEVHHVNC